MSYYDINIFLFIRTNYYLSACICSYICPDVSAKYVNRMGEGSRFNGRNKEKKKIKNAN